METENKEGFSTNQKVGGAVGVLLALAGAIGQFTGTLQPLIEKITGGGAVETQVASSTGTTVNTNKTINIDGSAKGGRDAKSEVKVGDINL